MAGSFTIGFLLFLRECNHLRRTADLPTPSVSAFSVQGVVALTGGGERIVRALEVLSHGKAQRLLITGVNQSIPRQEIARLTPKFESFFKCCVDLGYEALNTAGNAKETEQWARLHRMDSLIIVTSLYHLPRALVELNHVLPDVQLIPLPIIHAAPEEPSWRDKWRSAKIILAEYCKYLLAHVRLMVLKG